MELTNLYMDTHKIVRLLQDKGYSEQEAEGFIQAIQEITLTGVASKEDLRKTEARLKQEIEASNENVQKVESSLKEEIAGIKTDLTKLIYINTITTIGILTAIISIAVAIIKFS